MEKYNFINYKYKVNTKVEITDNPCGDHCCANNPKKEKYRGKIYTIAKIFHFGGGCPSITFYLKELPETNNYLTSLPSNWFRPINT